MPWEYYNFDLLAFLKALAASVATSGVVRAGSNRRNIFPDGLNSLLIHAKIFDVIHERPKLTYFFGMESRICTPALNRL